MINIVEKWLVGQGMPENVAQLIEITISLVLILIAALMARWIAKRFLIPIAEKAVHSSSAKWDDTLVGRGFFNRLASLLPVVVIYTSADLMFPDQSSISEFIKRLSMTLFVLFGVRILDSLLFAARDIYTPVEKEKGKSIGSYVDAVRIIAYVLAGIFMVSILTDKSPWGLLSVFGGLTAVLLLIFKDTILGFIAGIQLSAHDMIRIGDWLEMPKYEADGDVIDISIHTVKVRNWDKTITTIPTYALVSNSFKNWRGMSDSGGRRIKRALNIDMNSIKFCTEEMLAHYERYHLLHDYLTEKKTAIEAYNKEHGVDDTVLVNGRRQTNVGVFRAYIVAYLKAHPKIHRDMTFLVRHLAPTAQGLPIEIYVFSNDQVWANYEAIQADIFDHILAVAPHFDLRVYQYPSGYDLKALAAALPLPSAH